MRKNFFILMLIFLTSFAFFTISCNTRKTEIVAMAWMQGSYKDTLQNFYEHWEISGDTMLKGAGYAESGKDTGFYEDLAIKKTGNIWFYVVTTGGRQTLFRLTNKPGDSLVFENNGNEFPKRITYLRKDQGKIMAIIENPGLPETQIKFNFTPQK